jgi:LCP family protein required for cell wall assembly
MRRVRAALVPAIVITAALLLLVVLGLWTGIHNLAPRTSLSDILGISVRGPGSVAWKLQHDQPINLLLLARGGAGNDNPNVTDTIMVVSLQPRSRRALVVSLPRVAWVAIPAPPNGDVSGKLYSAYALAVHQDNAALGRDWQSPTGAGDLAAATVSRMTGLPIDYWVVIDIEGFRSIIDAVGGVRITVPVALDDPSYPVDDTGRVMRVRIAAGDQILDGSHALQYARSRLSTSEADRSQRQQQVLVATLARLHALSSSPRVVLLIGDLQGRLLTNLRLSDARQLAALAGGVDDGHIRRVIVDQSNFMVLQTLPRGDEILLPRDGDYAALRRYLAATVQEMR